MNDFCQETSSKIILNDNDIRLNDMSAPNVSCTFVMPIIIILRSNKRGRSHCQEINYFFSKLFVIVTTFCSFFIYGRAIIQLKFLSEDFFVISN